MDRDRKTAMYAGLLFLATIVFSIPALGIYARIRTDPNYVVGARRPPVCGQPGSVERC